MAQQITIRDAWSAPSYAGGNPTAAERLVWTFRHYRGRGMTARAALAKAREISGLELKAYPVVSGIGPVFRVGSTPCRWVERPADYGLRYADSADSLAGLRHTGWHMDDDGMDETARGAVFRLPSRRGRAVFVPAVLDPWNDGPAFFAFSDACDDADTAGRIADHVASVYADSAREYRRASDARVRFEDLGAHIKRSRRECLDLIREAKEHCETLRRLGRVQSLIRAAIKGYLADTAASRRKRAELLATFGNRNGWQDF